MRDASASYWFRIGDRVQVMDDVVKGGTNLRGICGTVVETWEKCDVDPTCCCAEQVDTGMAVRVEFSDDATGSLQHYFAETELLKLRDDDANDDKSILPFDGMSCTAFKLEQLQVGLNMPRSIASFVPFQSQADE